jgi:hypothetical protein
MPLTGNISEDIHEMSHSPNHRKRVSKFGKKKAHEMEVAAAASTHARKKKRQKAGRRKR